MHYNSSLSNIKKRMLDPHLEILELFVTSHEVTQN